jgi:hypothetical protein
VPTSALAAELTLLQRLARSRPGQLCHHRRPETASAAETAASGQRRQ